MGFKSDRGASLIMVSVLIVIIFISSSALMLTTSQSVTISRLAVHRNQSLMNARDGVQLAEQHAQQLWPTNPQSFVRSMNSYLNGLNQNGAPFTASLSQDSGINANTSTFTLHVTGKDQPYQKTLQVTMKAARVSVQNTVFQYVAYSKKSLYEVGNSAITGKTLIQDNIFHWNAWTAFFHKWPNWETNPDKENKTLNELAQFFSGIKNNSGRQGFAGGEHNWKPGKGTIKDLFGSTYSSNNTRPRNFPDLLPSPFQSFIQDSQSTMEQTAKQAGSNYHPSVVIGESTPLPKTGGYISRPHANFFVIKSNQTVNGPLYFDGSVVIQQGVTLTVNGPLYVNGNLVVNGTLQSAAANTSRPQKVYVSGTSWLSPSQDLSSKFVLISQGDIVVMPAMQRIHGETKVNNTATNINAFLISGGDIFLSNGFGYKGQFPAIGQDGTASLTLHGGAAAQGNIYLIDHSSIFSPGGSSRGASDEQDNRHGHDGSDGGNGQGKGNLDTSDPSNSESYLNLVYDPTFLQNTVIPGLPTANGSGQFSSVIQFTPPITGTG